MDWVSRRELKIFLTVFLVVALFVQVFGMNANSRIDLTRSIVERGALDINPYRNNTADRSYYNGTYYSNKAPGLSLLATPIYAGWKMVYNIWGDTTVHTHERTVLGRTEGRIISVATHPGSFFLSALILLIWLTATAAMAALSILVYRVSGTIVEREWLRLLVTFGFAFGTPAMHYGSQFLPNMVESFLMFSAFYIIYRYETVTVPHRLLVAGILGGFAVTVETLEFLVLGLLFLYAWRRLDRFPTMFIVGGFIGGLPYMAYNTIAFGAPWKLPPLFLDPFLWPFIADRSGFVFDPVRSFFISLRLLFYPYRGIFFWSPFLLVGFAGLRDMFHEDRETLGVIASIIVAGTVMVSLWWSWWHGGFFGARHMIFLLPYLMLPVCYGARHLVNRRGGRVILVTLLAFSVAYTAAGTYGNYENILMETESDGAVVRGLGDAKNGTTVSDPAVYQMKPEYFTRLKTFSVLANPLWDVYIPGFLENGPQSRFLSGLYNGDIPPDVRAYAGDPPFQLEKDRIPPVLLVWIIMIIVISLWWTEIKMELERAGQRLVQ